MISVDTNILLYAFDSRCPEHKNALAFVASQRDNQRFVICELVLIEFYCLIRNPALVHHPLAGR